MYEQLIQTITEIAQDIADEIFENEETIRQGIVIPILDELGWPVRNMRVVKPEFNLGGNPRKVVDVALCHSPGKPAILIEIKYLGKADEKGKKQLFDYCVRKGVPIAVLTDGCTWNFFYPAGQGSYEDRRFAQVDLLGDDHHTVASKLARYMDMEDVKSQTAWERATQDYKKEWIQKQAASEFESVWHELLSAPEPLLLDLFSEEVERKTGVKPSSERAAAFIREHAVGGEVIRKPPTVKSGGVGKPSTNRPKTPQPIYPKPYPRPPKQPSFTFREKTQTFTKGVDLFAAVFSMFAEMKPNFCQQYSERYAGRSRQYVARTKEELYPDTPRLYSAAVRLPGGWWLGTNLGNASKESRIKEACQIMGLEYGRDLVVEMPVGSRKKRG